MKEQMMWVRRQNENSGCVIKMPSNITRKANKLYRMQRLIDDHDDGGHTLAWVKDDKYECQLHLNFHEGKFKFKQRKVGDRNWGINSPVMCVVKPCYP